MPDPLQHNPSQGQALKDREETRNTFGNGALGETSGAGAGLSVSDPETPDTHIADTNDPSLGTSEEMERDAAEDARDDPLSQTGTYEGKKVFRPNELNQAGEDKEYFHPEDHHRFRVPSDAQHHVLKPDVTLTPGERPTVEIKPKT